MRRRRRRWRGWCNVAIYFACWPLAGIPPVLAISAFMYCTPFMTQLMLKWGWSTTSISGVSVGPDDLRETVLIVALLSLIGGISMTIAVLVARMIPNRRPRWTRAIRMMPRALVSGAVPLGLVIFIAETLLLIHDPSGMNTGIFLVLYLLLGASFCVIVHAAARGGWRVWRLRAAHVYVPKQPCSSCGYELENLHSDRCPECGHGVMQESHT